MTGLIVLMCTAAVHWQHPAGLITQDTINEIRDKRASQPWAERVFNAKRAEVDAWVSVPEDKLRAVFPTKRGNVYHNFSCPDDRTRLKFDPFESSRFHCDTCGKDFDSSTDAGVYPVDNVYHGTMYDGWACMFYQAAGAAAADLAIVSKVDGNPAYAARAKELLLLFANTIHQLPTDKAGKQGDDYRILTYRREGDNKVLNDLAVAYELVRDSLSAEERTRVEQDVLVRMLNDVMLEPIYRYNHNNIYQWHRTIMQVAAVLEREDLIDWSSGYGAFAPEQQPEHTSLRKALSAHFRPDGAYWELCSGYHLYPVFFLCEAAFLTHNLSRMDPARFPPATYDLTDPANADRKVIKGALEWFMSMAMPDRTMPTIGDSTAPRAGMSEYTNTAEIGYRFYDVRAVGDYESLRRDRSWVGLLYGAPEVVQQPIPYTSSYLSSGWCSLRNEHEGNRVWVGLNALQPGGGHQHADRLGLTFYSHGQLLAIEKATPYNELRAREIGTLSSAHTTVTVDMASQKQGEDLAGAEIPEVAVFSSGSFVRFAQLRGDHLYAQTRAYRRSVALIEDVVLDFFQVEGGSTHDWMAVLAGPRPTLSIPTEPAEFKPVEWLYNGSNDAKHAMCDGDWNAQWAVEGVTSRLTMMGAPATHVYALETYPADNAVVAAGHPPCQTLCVRRNDDAPFLAVWDAWRDAPNAQSITRAGTQNALVVRTKANVYHAAFGPGEFRFDDGLTMATDAVFAILRNRETAAFAGGTTLDVSVEGKPLRLKLSEPGSCEANGTVVTLKAPPIQYDTFGGEDHLRPADAITSTAEAVVP